MTNKKQYKLGASLISSKILNLKENIRSFERGKIDYIHFDVMDGVFVPRLGLFPEVLQEVHSITRIPIEVHMMLVDPKSYIEKFIQAGAEKIIIHLKLEEIKNSKGLLQLLKKKGVKLGVAINPDTPIDVLDDIISDLSTITLMAVPPGSVGKNAVSNIFQKIVNLKARFVKNPNILIEIDGGVDLKTAPKMVGKGADLLVCGRNAIFQKEGSIDENIANLRQAIDNFVF